MLLSVDDFEKAAHRRLPRALWGFVAGGCETNTTLSGNREAYRAYAFRPRVLLGATERSQSVELFGKTWASPVGIAPMGGNDLSAWRADRNLAAGAKRAGIPFILSGASSVSLEAIHDIHPDAWFQAYLPYSREDKKGLAERVARAGYDTFVITVDMTLPGNRENNLRNGFNMPVKPNWRLALQSAMAPGWFAGTFVRTLAQDGGWFFQNQGPNRGGSMLKPPPAGTRRGHESLNWDDMRFMRDVWKKNLVIKGVLAPEDAARAREIGADAVIVSNHGGRQLDGTVAPLHALPAVVAAAGTMPVLMDGGIRRGTDALKALALGAKYVFAGRPFLYGAIVGGEEGVAKVASILREEIDRNQALLGCPSIEGLNESFLCAAGAVAPAVPLERRERVVAVA